MPRFHYDLPVYVTDHTENQTTSHYVEFRVNAESKEEALKSIEKKTIDEVIRYQEVLQGEDSVSRSINGLHKNQYDFWIDTRDV